MAVLLYNSYAQAFPSFHRFLFIYHCHVSGFCTSFKYYDLLYIFDVLMYGRNTMTRQNEMYEMNSFKLYSNVRLSGVRGLRRGGGKWDLKRIENSKINFGF